MPLPELPVCDASADVVLRVGGGREPAGAGREVHRWELPDGSLWLTISRTAGGYLLWFAEMATFFVSEDGARVRCWPCAWTPEDTLRHLFLDQVMPLVMARRGRTVLHASVVALDCAAVAFAGVSGMGKSTLAGAMVKRGGASLVSDDCLVLEENGGGFETVPSYPGLRLWPDVVAAVSGAENGVSRVCHYSRKARVELGFSGARLPLRRIYLLERGEDGVSAARVAGLDAMMAVVKSSYVLDPEDREELGRQFASAGRIAGMGLCSRLSYPRELERLGEVCAAVSRDARAFGG
jgi:hypothetical protein